MWSGWDVSVKYQDVIPLSPRFPEYTLKGRKSHRNFCISFLTSETCKAMPYPSPLKISYDSEEFEICSGGPAEDI